LAWERAQFAEAESLFPRQLEGLRASPGAPPAQVADALNDLAMTIQIMSAAYDEAKALLRESLEIRRKVLDGDEHPETAASLSNLALVLREHGAYPDAHALWARALEIHRKRLGASHQSLGISLAYWGESIRRSGDAKGGEEVARGACGLRSGLAREPRSRRRRRRAPRRAV
jgi:tetratricopeptide (TPR) repeat protein